jgi:hypothetical protein
MIAVAQRALAEIGLGQRVQGGVAVEVEISAVEPHGMKHLVGRPRRRRDGGLHALWQRCRHLGRGDLGQKGLGAGRDEHLARVEHEVLRPLARMGREHRPVNVENCQGHAARRGDAAVVQELAGHVGQAHDDGIDSGLREQALAQLRRKAFPHAKLALEKAMGLGMRGPYRAAVALPRDLPAAGHRVDDLGKGFALVGRDGFDAVAVADVSCCQRQILSPMDATTKARATLPVKQRPPASGRSKGSFLA